MPTDKLRELAIQLRDIAQGHAVLAVLLQKEGQPVRAREVGEISKQIRAVAEQIDAGEYDSFP